jgi:beta-lactam-binding protein with PASTA domain
MPSLVDGDIDDALEAIEVAGFTRVLVRIATEAEGVASGRVLGQNPQSQELVMKTRTIELEISPLEEGAYTAEVVYNVDVTRKNDVVMVVLKQGIAEFVLFEEPMSDGRQTIPLTIASADGEEAEVIVYVDGIEVRRTVESFTLRGA